MKTLWAILLGVSMVFGGIGAAGEARADTVALTFTGGFASGKMGDPVPNTIGWEFTLSAPVTVTRLGYYDAGGDGVLAERHPIAIWDTATQEQKVYAQLFPGDAFFSDGYGWVALALPVTLAAGTYRIGAAIWGNDPFYTWTDTRTTASPVSYVGGVYVVPANPVNELVYPTVTGNTTGRFGPNFQFTAVPVPPALLLLGPGLVALLAARGTPKTRDEA